MLTNDEIDMLMDALDALVSKIMTDVFLGTLMESAMCSPENRAAAQAQAEHEMQRAKDEKRRISERVILLKAKLINMRDQEALHLAAKILAMGEGDVPNR